MKLKSLTTKIAATAVCALMVCPAFGKTPDHAATQTLTSSNVPGLSLTSSNRRETMRTVMVISAILLLAGLLDDNGTLIAIGGAGLIISLLDTESNKYRQSYRGLDLVTDGRFSLGVRPFGQMGLAKRTSTPQPSLYLQAKFKF
ncbi:MAG: hypothetical protein QOJ65_1596 [Fimbriimonadaceae bacterium]|nr:hypothetical protein [Fimbriimonadaceae bacterium]